MNENEKKTYTKIVPSRDVFTERRSDFMDKNPSIACTVTSCSHHAVQEDYCTLSAIKVGTHEANPTQCECTDCESFDLKSSNCGCK